MSGGAAASVMTVPGPIAATELGMLAHEHVSIDLPREYRGVGLLADEGLAMEELSPFSAAGGTTTVDCTSEGLGRRPEALRRVSETTGIAVAMGSGSYRRPHLDEARIEDVRGRAGRRERARPRARRGRQRHQGGHHRGDRVRPGDERHRGTGFRAAARAHRRTGVTGHDPGRPVASGRSAAGSAGRGGWTRPASSSATATWCPTRTTTSGSPDAAPGLQFDTTQGVHEVDTLHRLAWIRGLVDAGFEGRPLLSQDVCLTSDLAAYGRPGYA